VFCCPLSATTHLWGHCQQQQDALWVRVSTLLLGPLKVISDPLSKSSSTFILLRSLISVKPIHGKRINGARMCPAAILIWLRCLEIMSSIALASWQIDFVTTESLTFAQIGDLLRHNWKRNCSTYLALLEILYNVCFIDHSSFIINIESAYNTKVHYMLLFICIWRYTCSTENWIKQV